MYARFGAEVTALETAPQILPGEDEAAAAALTPALEQEGIRLLTDISVERADHDGTGWTLALGGGETLRTEALLVATGRTPVFDVHDLSAAEVGLDRGGPPALSETPLRTTADDIWAAGDATGDLLFTHVGMYEAGLVVDDILGNPRPRDYRVVPRVTFCDPEIASVGLTELAAREAGHEVGPRSTDRRQRTGDDGREPAGVVKLVADARTGELLGGHIVAEDAGAMIHEIVAAMAGRVPTETIIRCGDPRPTPPCPNR